MSTGRKLNAEWHLANKMPRNATLEQRVAWHKQHAKECACRPIPPNILTEMKKRKAARAR